MKKQVLNPLKKLQNDISENIEEYSSHLVIGLDQNEDGTPYAQITIASGKPAEMIGMCDVLIRNLKNIKKKAIKENYKTSRGNDKRIESMLKDLPAPIAEKIRELKLKLDNAVADDNQEEIQNIFKELRKLKFDPRMNDDEDNDGSFNINDFK